MKRSSATQTSSGMIPGDARLVQTLEARDISKSFDTVRVLDRVTLTLRKGEVHTLLGENGAGKSTLIKILSGVYRPDFGQILLDGLPVHLASPRAALAHGIYRVPQEPSLIPHLSIAENMFLGVMPTRGGPLCLIKWRMIQEQAADALGRLGLAIDPLKQADTLSIAQQQLAECARALIHKCGIIFFDEPTSPLTRHEVSTLFAVIGALRESGCAIAFISHRLNEVFEISDRITVLRDGHLVDCVDREQATRERLVEQMVGRPVSHTISRPRRSPIGPPVLEVRDLSDRSRFEQVSFEIGRGEIVGLAGLVGSGRTEIAETICGLRPRTNGTVVLGGHDVTGQSIRSLVKAGLVYIPEDRTKHSIFAGLPIMHNISAGDLDLIRQGRSPLIDRTKEVNNTRRSIADMRIRASSVHSAARHLSGGNQQKAILSRWLLTQPKIAIFDEPTRGIDVSTKQDIYALVEKLARQGLGVLVISSELEELIRLCDRILTVYEGRIVGELRDEAISLSSLGQSILSPQAAV